MQWLALVSEDAGVQRLKADNRLPATTPNVDAVAPYPRVHGPGTGNHPQHQQRAPVGDRRRNDDRRQGERRREQVPVILDTRSKHDRRAFENRRATTGDAATPVRMRLNLYA